MPDFDASPYGLYVWPAYAATAAAFGWMVMSSLMRAQRWRRAVEALETAPKDEAG